MGRLSVLILCAACAGKGDDSAALGEEVRLRFSATVGGAPLVCGDNVSAQGGVEMGDLRLYVSNFALLDEDGAEHPLTLVNDGLWQTQTVALLDFEDGSGPCAETGTAATNATVIGRVDAAGPFVGLSFDLGLPFDENHADATAAPSPLNVPAMFWSWQVGYKFIGLDLAVAEGPWFVHLGSTDCESASPIEAPAVECGHPNRAHIRLDGADPTATVVNLDLDRLLATADLHANAEGSPPGCMSDPSDGAECGPVFAALGMDWSVGDCVDGCAGQTAFAWSAP